MYDPDAKKIYHNKCKDQEKIEGRTILFDNGTLYLIFPFDSYLITLIKQIAAAIWDTEIHLWKVVNPTPVSAKQLLDFAELCSFEYDAKILFYLEALITEGAQKIVESMASRSSFE